MKKLSWQQWTAIAIIALVIITGIIFHLVQPNVSFAFTELIGSGCFIAGGISGYMLKKNNVIKTNV